MAIGIGIAIVLFVIAWIVGWIVVWVKGTKKQNTMMVVLGGLFSLGIIGLIIAIIQTNGWQNNNTNLELEKQKLELQKQQIEIEKQNKQK
ncbi:MAG: hypothetical protein HRT98_01280 [Mycoplasmatales bacterium]|nr:hypothetical protein [Mycoplasmatales bacterium]